MPIPHMTRGNEIARHRAVHEVLLNPDPAVENSIAFEPPVTVEFIRPDRSVVQVDPFCDGFNGIKARAYCDMIGTWLWRVCGRNGVNGNGTFTVAASKNKGKLRINGDDPGQFSYDNGNFFLHLGDTAYQLMYPEETSWQSYLQQAARVGFTKIRTWLCRRYDSDALLLTPDRGGFNLWFWQEIERRLLYGLTRFPHIMFQLILYGEDSRELLRFASGDKAVRAIARYAQARFSAFPNVCWCISNDMPVVKPVSVSGGNQEDRQAPDTQKIRQAVDMAGSKIAGREPWGTLITSHQTRFTGYSFTDAPWSDLVTLNDLGQVSGERIREYREKVSCPVVLEQDRYEHRHAPDYPRYYFRRLFWASILSGGHATYGGLISSPADDGATPGICGYFDACRDGKLAGGAHDLSYINKFVRDVKMTFPGMIPDDGIVGNKPLEFKAMRSANYDTVIVYCANPDETFGHAPDGYRGNYTDTRARGADLPVTVNIELPAGNYQVKWYNPSSGEWFDGTPVNGEAVSLSSPDGEDWVVVFSARAKIGGSGK